MTEYEISLRLRSGHKFTGRNGAFSGTVTPISFNGNTMIVECQKDGCIWKEEWDVLTTVWGFDKGYYEFI